MAEDPIKSAVFVPSSWDSSMTPNRKRTGNLWQANIGTPNKISTVDEPSVSSSKAVFSGICAGEAEVGLGAARQHPGLVSGQAPKLPLGRGSPSSSCAAVRRSDTGLASGHSSATLLPSSASNADERQGGDDLGHSSPAVPADTPHARADPVYALPAVARRFSTALFARINITLFRREQSGLGPMTIPDLEDELTRQYSKLAKSFRFVLQVCEADCIVQLLRLHPATYDISDEGGNYTVILMPEAECRQDPDVQHLYKDKR